MGKIKGKDRESQKKGGMSGSTKKNKKGEWWYAECWDKKKEVRVALTSMRKVKGEDQREKWREEYWRRRKEYKKICSKKRQKWMIQRLEQVSKLGEEKDFGEYINSAERQKNQGEHSITGKKWTDYFHMLLGKEGREGIIEQESRMWEDYGSRIHIDKVRGAIRKLKRGKAAGVDNIENEVWKYGSQELQQELLELINKV